MRIMAGLLFLAHGTQKFLGFPAGDMAGSGWSFAHPGAYAGIIELVTGLLIAIGLFTRPAAFLASAPAPRSARMLASRRGRLPPPALFAHRTCSQEGTCT